MGMVSRVLIATALMYGATAVADTGYYSGVNVVPDIKAEMQFYRVSGATLGEVMQQISQHPSSGHLGRASYQLSWALQTRAGVSRCELEQVRAISRIKVMMPNWIDKTKATMAERKQWDRLVGAMFDYESRHKDILLESVSVLGTRLVQLPVESDCAALQYQAWQQGQGVLANTRTRFASLQQQTDHGRKLGLVWPLVR